MSEFMSYNSLELSVLDTPNPWAFVGVYSVFIDGKKLIGLLMMPG